MNNKLQQTGAHVRSAMMLFTRFHSTGVLILKSFLSINKKEMLLLSNAKSARSELLQENLRFEPENKHNAKTDERRNIEDKKQQECNVPFGIVSYVTVLAK